MNIASLLQERMEKELGVLKNFKPQFFLRRYLDDFDYVAFLNETVSTAGIGATL